MGLKVQCESSSHDVISGNDARFRLMGETIFNSVEDKMLGGDCGLNLTQRCVDSPKEVLRQTMLNQEIIFRKQVNELHRLYTTQKMLMNDFGWKGFSVYNFRKASTQYTAYPSVSPIIYESLARERTSSTVPMVSSTQSKTNGRGISHRVEKGSLHFQFLSSHCSSYDEEVKLSLSTGGETRTKSVGGQTWNDKITSSFPIHIIDLEESSESVSNENAKSMSALGCAAPLTLGHKHNLEIPMQSCRKNQDIDNGGRNDPSYVITFADSFLDGSKNCQKQNSFNQGSNECRGDLPPDNMFTEGKLVASYETAFLDLNKVQLDESSIHSNEPMVAYASSGSSSGVSHGPISELNGGGCSTAFSWREQINNQSDEAVVLDPHGALNPIFIDSNSNNSNDMLAINGPVKEVDGDKVCSIGLQSVSVPISYQSTNLGNCTRSSEHEYVEVTGNFHSRKHTDLAVPKENDEKENIVSSHALQDKVEDTHSSISPPSCKFDCNADDISRSTKGMYSANDVRESNPYPLGESRKLEPSQVAEIPSPRQSKFPDAGELKNQCCDQNKRESAEVDILIQTAAVSLIYISKQPGSTEIEDEDRQPQNSVDSYESMVLKLTDSTDDNCVSSKPIEVEGMDKKENGIKLRRGRRLKDFQKDILPGLASLSRREIWEDIKLMEGVIRSREYKRLRAKTINGTNGDNWFTPVRSKRSRLNYVGRSYYS